MVSVMPASVTCSAAAHPIISYAGRLESVRMNVSACGVPVMLIEIAVRALSASTDVVGCACSPGAPVAATKIAADLVESVCRACATSGSKLNLLLAISLKRNYCRGLVWSIPSNLQQKSLSLKKSRSHYARITKYFHSFTRKDKKAPPLPPW